MTDAERAALHRDLLQLAGWRVVNETRRVMSRDIHSVEIEKNAWWGYKPGSEEATGYHGDVTEEIAWARYCSLQPLTIDWLLSLLPTECDVRFECSNSLLPTVCRIWLYDPVEDFVGYAATRLDALALAARDYKKAAGNG